MNDLTHSRTYNNVFHGQEDRTVSNKITVRHNRVGEQGNCPDWTNPFPKIVALDGDKATFFSGDIWDHENFREGKPHMGIVFEAIKIGDFYYANEVLADIRQRSLKRLDLFGSKT